MLQPAGQAEGTIHYTDTVENPVNLSRLAEFLSPDEVSDLKSMYPDGVVPTWGVTRGKTGSNATKWEKISRGDLALFSRSGGIFSCGVVTMKTHNASLASRLWKTNTDGDTWEYVYFIDEVRPMSLSYEEFNRVVGYKPNNVIQGFTVLNEVRSERVLESLGLWSESHSDVMREEYVDIVSGFDPSKPLDSEVIVKRRKEQSFLRSRLFGNRRDADCCICGRTLSVDLLVAAHVKKRSVCTTEEMRDWDHIVVPMCYLGCDRLYEKGYLTVERGSVRVQKDMSFPESVRSVLDGLDGRSCPHWSNQTEPYFKWHRVHNGFE